MNNKKGSGEEHVPELQANSFLIKCFNKAIDDFIEISEKIPGVSKIEDERLQLSYPLMLGVISNIKCIELISINGYQAETYIVARAFIERAVTFFYLQYCSKDELDDYDKYTKQKVYRKLETKTYVDKSVVPADYTSLINLSLNKDMNDAVEKFTSKVSIKPITRWSKKNIEDKVNLIRENDKKIADVIELGLEHVYDDASEALHGTIYGCMFPAGIFDVSRTTEDKGSSAEYFVSNVLSLTVTMSTCLSSILEFFIKKEGLDELGVEIKKINTGIEKALKIMTEEK